MRYTLLSSFALAVGLVGPASAHPHVFIDTAFELVVDAQGRLSAVRIDWSYDAFYSLLLIEENGLDADADGVPEQAALDAFAGQDVDWEAGFPGDFVITKDGAPVALDGPTDHAVRFEKGRVVTSHIRPITTPVDLRAHTIVARSYDPTYFVSYDVPVDPSVAGQPGCSLQREAADRAAAQAQYGDRLAAIDMTDDPFEEIELPDIGILFADSFRLICNGSS